MSTVTVKAHGIDEVVARIRGVRNRAQHTSRPTWDAIGDVLRNAYAEQFATEGAFLGKKWRPLSPRYATWKQAHHPEGTILVLSGQLRRSYIDKTKAVSTIHGDTGYFGSSDPIAKYHQYGTRFMPARRVVIINHFLRNHIKRIEADYVMGRRP